MSPSGVTSAFDALQSAAAIDLNPINCQSHRANDYLPCPYSSSIPVVNYSHSMCLQLVFFQPACLVLLIYFFIHLTPLKASYQSQIGQHIIRKERARSGIGSCSNLHNP